MPNDQQTTHDTQMPYDPPTHTPFGPVPTKPTKPSKKPAALSSSNPGGPGPSSTSIAAVQAQVDEAVGIMRENLRSAAARGETLESLESRTESLAIAAQAFRRSAHRVHKDIWWKEMKMRFIVGLAIAVVVTFTVISIIEAARSKQRKPPPGYILVPQSSPTPIPTAGFRSQQV